MVIRPCNLADGEELAAVWALQRAAYEVEAGLIGTRMIPGLRETQEELLAAAALEVFWGCEVEIGGERRLAGIVAVEDEGTWLRISRLAVDPRMFRCGVGRALVRHVAGMARAQRRRLRVSTGASNGPGRALYVSEGFEVVGEFAASDGTGLVMMELR